MVKNSRSFVGAIRDAQNRTLWAGMSDSCLKKHRKLWLPIWQKRMVLASVVGWHP